MGLMVNPPKPGDISYLKYATERLNILPSYFFPSAICIFLEKNPMPDSRYVSVYILMFIHNVLQIILQQGYTRVYEEESTHDD
jgi:hypothetical protein